LNFLKYWQRHIDDLTRTEIPEKLLKSIKFLLSLTEKDLTTLLVAARERIENIK